MTPRNFEEGRDSSLNEIAQRALDLGSETALSQDVRLLVTQLLQSEVIVSLSEAGVLGGVILQGGAALLRCYGGKRLSNDLDFVATAHPTDEIMRKAGHLVSQKILDDYGVEARVRLKGFSDAEKRGTVARMQIKVPVSLRPDVPMTFVKVEFAKIPSHTRVARRVEGPLDMVGGSWLPLVSTEDPSELVADKLTSASLAAKRVFETGSGPHRARDMYDTCWLCAETDVDMSAVGKLVSSKEQDYGVEEGTVNAWLPAYIELLSRDNWRALSEVALDVWDDSWRERVSDGRCLAREYARLCGEIGFDLSSIARLVDGDERDSDDPIL